jgi:hypothetical protein
MDGMSLLQTLKQRWPESEVIIITGYPSVDTAKEAIRLGACDYLAAARAARGDPEPRIAQWNRSIGRCTVSAKPRWGRNVQNCGTRRKRAIAR